MQYWVPDTRASGMNTKRLSPAPSLPLALVGGRAARIAQPAPSAERAKARPGAGRGRQKDGPPRGQESS
eukprot:11203181-Lingulodinium_polyedra.AAC.1